MDKTCTDIEQSNVLIKLGIDTKTADMKYPYFGDGQYGTTPVVGECIKFSGGVDIPAWSLSALLKLMPKMICIRLDEHSGNFYRLEWQFANDNSLRYVGENRTCLIDIYSDHDNGKPKDNIDTAVEMVKWLLENKKISK